MQYLTYFFGLAAFFMSMLGVMLLFHLRLKLDASLTPAAAVSTVTVAVYLGGFLHLAAACTLVYGAGCLLFALYVIRAVRGKVSLTRFVTSPGVIAFLLICLFFILRTRGMTVLHADNFSHWATVIRDMCLTDAYPIPEGAVTFRNYTPGSAVFVYHVCRAVGFSEARALMAQGVMIASALSALFCGFRLKKPLSCLAMCAVTVSLLAAFELESASLGIYNFLVDGLIAYFAAAGGVIAYSCRHSLTRCAAALIPVSATLSLIKSSARIFSFFIIILAFLLLFGEHFRRKGRKKKLIFAASAACTVGVNLLLPQLWNIYQDRAFAGYVNKFPSDVGSLLSRITSREPSYIREIAAKIAEELNNLTSPTSHLLSAAFAISAVTLVLCLICRSRVKFTLSVTLCCAAVGVFYILELFVLYAFIFDPAESEVLASFYRYYATASLLLSSVLLTASIHTLSRLTLPFGGFRVACAASAVAVAAAGILSLIPVRDNLILLVCPYGREDAAVVLERREDFSEFYSDVSTKVPPNSFMLVYTEKTDFFTTTLPQYELRTTHCLFLYAYMFSNEELIRQRLSYPDYIVVESGHDSFEALMKSRGYTFSGDGIVYSVNKDTLTLTAK